MCLLSSATSSRRSPFSQSLQAAIHLQFRQTPLTRCACPLDIILQIIDGIEDSAAASERFGWYKELQTVSALASTCRVYRDIVQPRLYRTARLTVGHERVQRLLDLLLNNPALFSYTKALLLRSPVKTLDVYETLQTTSYAAMNMISRFPNLECLCIIEPEGSLQGYFQSYGFGGLTTIRELYIDSCLITSMPRLFAFLDRLPHLKSLALQITLEIPDVEHLDAYSIFGCRAETLNLLHLRLDIPATYQTVCEWAIRSGRADRLQSLFARVFDKKSSESIVHLLNHTAPSIKTVTIDDTLSGGSLSVFTTLQSLPKLVKLSLWTNDCSDHEQTGVMLTGIATASPNLAEVEINISLIMKPPSEVEALWKAMEEIPRGPHYTLEVQISWLPVGETKPPTPEAFLAYLPQTNATVRLKRHP
jgi:hypothetical protein